MTVEACRNDHASGQQLKARRKEKKAVLNKAVGVFFTMLNHWINEAAKHWDNPTISGDMQNGLFMKIAWKISANPRFPKIARPKRKPSFFVLCLFIFAAAWTWQIISTAVPICFKRHTDIIRISHCYLYNSI